MNSDKLNDKQREAATKIDGALLILAGAGSGKTSTMTYRMAYMVEQGISPYNILAVTFTNKAAKEMRSRVENLVGDTRGMWIMTFHAMCLRILRMYGESIGYGSNFVIYDPQDQKVLIRDIMKKRNIDKKEYKPSYFLSAISGNKEKKITPENFFVENDETAKSRIVYTVYNDYEEEKKKNNAMDFDDLLLNTVKLFEADEEVLERCRDRFKYIMVDEYQDTNRIQYEIVKMLAGRNRNLCVVGDDDQCIYQWRGADIRNILDFEKDFPEAEVIKLEQNYRSRGNILAAAYSVIKNNSERKKKKLWTDKDPGEKLTYYRADDEKDEATYIADRIIEIMAKGNGTLKTTAYSDFAVLYRTNAQSRNFEEAFTRRGIPYRVLSGLRYYDRKEIKDIMAYMRLVVNPADNVSLMRVINEPKRGMGDKTVSKVSAHADVLGLSMFDALCEFDVLDTLPGKSFDKVREMTETVKACREEGLAISEIYDRLLTGTGYLQALEKSETVEDAARIENLMEFKTVIFDYEADHEKPDLGEFMESLTLMADVDNHDEAQNAVVLMTMHSAKGLEFPVVFMPGMEDGLFPGHRAFDSSAQMEEERRLCYVGMTRAKEKLFLTGAKSRMLYGRRDYTRESCFMREVDNSLLEGDSVFSMNGFTSTGQSGSNPGVSTGGNDGYRSKGKSFYKPYDAVKRAREATKTSAKGSGGDLKEGDRVKHVKFGEGSIKDASGKIVTVQFDSGETKKLAKGIAPLEKL